MTRFIAFVILVATPLAHAGGEWLALIHRLSEKQNYSQQYGFYLLTHIAPSDPTQTHQSDYLEGRVLIYNDDGTLAAASIAAVSETWTRDGDYWDIKQTHDTANADGVLVDTFHQHLRETLDGTVVLDEYIKADPVTSAPEVARWEAVKQRWFDWNK